MPGILVTGHGLYNLGWGGVLYEPPRDTLRFSNSFLSSTGGDCYCKL